MPYKDLEKRKRLAREGMRKVRGMVTLGDVNPDDVNPSGEESEPFYVNPCSEASKAYPNYDISPKHKSGCVCMLCAPEKWPDLKVRFEKHIPIKDEAGRKICPNYDIHPAHSSNCDCLCCLGGATGKDGKFKLIKDLVSVL